MRLLAIGDVHGCLDALNLLLEELSPGSEDVVVTLGDYVDRGPESQGVLDRLLQLREETRLIPLLGNHDWMFLNALRGKKEVTKNWLRVGGEETLFSYGGIQQVPERHRRFLEHDCLRWWQAEDLPYFFVHGSADPEVPLDAQTEEWLLWHRVHEQTLPHVSGRTMVCGHTAQKTGVPWVQPGAVCIDTCACGKGWLTCFDVGAQTFLQAKDSGEMRTLDWDVVSAGCL